MDLNLYNTNKKYQNLIDTGKSLFSTFGIKKVTIEEICDKADVSKVTFYKFFRNKDDFILQLMIIVSEKNFQEYQAIIDGSMPFLDKIEAFLSLKINISKEYSDTFVEELVLFTSTDSAISDYYSKLLARSIEMNLKLFELGKKEGLIRNDIKPDFFIYFFNHIRTMMIDEDLKLILPDVHERIKILTNLYFLGFFKR